MQSGATAVLAAAAEALPFGVAITDVHGIVTWANAAYAELTGCNPDELIGQSAGDFPWDALAQAAPSSEPLRGQAVSQRESSETCSVEHSITAIRNPAGEATRFWIMKRGITGQRPYYEGFVEDITERKRAEAALRKSEEKFAKAFLSSPAAVALSDFNDDGRFVDVNETFELVNGYRRDEAIGRTALELGMWADVADFDKCVEQFLAAGRLRNFEHRFRRKNGEIGIGLTSADVIEIDCKPLVISATIDITEQKLAQTQLQNQSQRIHKIIENTDAGYFRMGMDGCYEDVNPAFLRMYGFGRKEEVIGLHFSALQVPEDIAKAEKTVEALNRGESAKSGEFSRLRRDGTVGYHSFSTNPVLDGDRVIGLEGFLVDISDQKIAERQRQHSEHRYRSLFNSMQEGVAVHRLFYANGLPENYILLDVNRRYEEILGVRREDVVDKLATDVYGTQNAPYLSKYAAVVESGTPLQFETYFPPMERHFVISVTPMGDDCFATIFFDVTHQRKVEGRYKLISENAADVIWLWDLAKNQCVYVSPSVTQLRGFTPEEVLGQSMDQAMPPNTYLITVAEQERRRATLESGDESARTSTDEIEYLRKDGTTVATETVTKLLTDERSGVRLVLGISRDITERKRAEAAIIKANEALAKAEAHYRRMFNSVSDAVFVHKLDGDGLPGQYLEVNDPACRLLGYTREELLQMRVFDLFAPEAHPNLRANVQELLADGCLLCEGPIVAKNGRRIPVEAITRVFELDGSPMFIASMRDISQRKRAEQQYRDIFDGALEGMYRTSPQGKFLVANPALARMMGYESAEHLVSTIGDLSKQVWSDPNDRARFAAILEKHGSVRGFECQVKREDGSTFWLSVNGRRVCGVDGTTAYYDGFAADITERKRAETALRKSEEKFAKAFQCSPAIMVLVDVAEEGRIVDVNEAFELVNGYRREEVIGHTPNELGMWVDLGEYDESIKQFSATGRLRNFEHRVRKKTGEIGIHLTSAEVVELDGKPLVVSTSIDITQQKKTEEAMRSLVTAIEQCAETIVITDLEGTIKYCNTAFERTTGYSKEEAIGQNPRILKSGRQDTQFYERLWAAITSGNVWAGTLVNKKKDGSLYEEDATISPIRDSSGRITGFVAAKRDITEQRELEGLLRQAQKLESIGRLAGGVAHDFNNLLTVINGYTGFLLKKLKGDDPLRAYADEIKTAGERAASLTRQLLAFSRKQIIEPRVLNLNTTIQESAPMLQRLIGEDIALGTHLEGSLGQVMADPDQLHQVIMNLAVNARDAMPDGGTLDIETMNVEFDEVGSVSLHHAVTPGRYVLMTVTDNGHGMDEAIRQQVFEPFFTTKGVGKGTGLGLATVYGIIRQSGGWIGVTSEVGVGTSFKICLPRTDASLLVEPAGMSAPTEGGETILVVEDQEAVRGFTGAALREFGYHVLEASDGSEAIAVVKSHPGPIHLLLTDVVMPGIDGKELSQRLREMYLNLKVLFMSGYTADVIAQRGVLDCGLTFLQKPFSTDELAVKVREVLDGPTVPTLEL